MSENREIEPLTRAEFAERKHWPDGQAAMQGFVIDHDDVLVNLKRQLDARDARIAELEAALRETGWCRDCVGEGMVHPVWNADRTEIMGDPCPTCDGTGLNHIAQATIDQITRQEDSA